MHAVQLLSYYVLTLVVPIVVGKNQWPACENLEKNYVRVRSTPPNSKKPARKVRSRPLLVPFFRVSEWWKALAHSFARGVRTLVINYFRGQ